MLKALGFWASSNRASVRSWVPSQVCLKGPKNNEGLCGSKSEVSNSAFGGCSLQKIFPKRGHLFSLVNFRQPKSMNC